MLATQANHVVHEGKLVKGCITRIKSFQSNNVKGKKYALFRGKNPARPEDTNLITPPAS